MVFHNNLSQIDEFITTLQYEKLPTTIHSIKKWDFPTVMPYGALVELMIHIIYDYN